MHGIHVHDVGGGRRRPRGRGGTGAVSARSGNIMGPHISHTSSHSIGIRQGFTVLEEYTGQLSLLVHIR
jgi:hypothetical protein